MKTAIVTGASGNLGQAVVKKFLSAEYHVVGTLVPNHPVDIDFTSKNFTTAFVDLTNEEATRQFVESVILQQEKIDVAVLTVGGFAMGTIAETRTSDLLKQYKLNFETAYNIARPVFAHMLEQDYGRIFLIGSRPGSDMAKSKGMVAYGMAKSLIFRLAELMNGEAKGKNVVTGVIVPSTIDTPQNRQSMPDADHTKWVSPEAVADLIFIYSGPQADIAREPVIKAYGNS
jgi:NAD(P)-dependent dehydrogenase (short-subunit alcohol dehydrogenase family)